MRFRTNFLYFCVIERKNVLHMATKEKTIGILNTIQSLAMVLVGSGIFSMGTTYFNEQSEYRIPRILIPVYELLGTIGLAIGMILLGVLIIYWGYRKFISYNRRAIYILTFALICIVGFYAILYTTTQKPTYEDAKSSIEQMHKKTEDAIKNSERPDIDLPVVNNYLNQLDSLKEKAQIAASENNREKLEAYREEYYALNATSLKEVSKALMKHPKQKDFYLYNAKIGEEIDSYLGYN